MADSTDKQAKSTRKVGCKYPPPEETQWQPGQSGNPEGRPKKIYSQFKEQGYKLAQINDTYMAMIGLHLDELEKIKGDKDGKYTALEMVVASSLIKSIKDGQMRELETLMNRAHGFPKQSVDQSSSIKLEVNTSEEDAKKLYEDTIAKLEQIDKEAEQPKTE